MAKRPGAQLTLTSFFAKKARKEDSSNLEVQLAECTIDKSSTNTEFSGYKETESTISGTDSTLHHLDLGNYLRAPVNKIDRETKVQLLKTPWVPDSNYVFPSSGKRNLKFQIQWLSRFKWLTYTKIDGALCKYCVLFASETAGKGGHQQLKSLVREPFNNWKDALEIFKAHENNAYHKECMITGSNFLSTSLNPNRDIQNVIDSSRLKQIQENRDKLHPIVDTIKLCGRQELALRGSNDYGPLTANDLEPVINDGNFRTILRMRMQCGDVKLLSHTENMALNATYMSPIIQNEIINICGSIIQKKIISSIVDAGVFSILVDETADISGYEQMSLCVRYTKQSETCYIVKEDFLGFFRLEQTTGEYISNSIITLLRQLGLDCKNMVGQGYDGASAMKGSFKGVQACIKKEYPQALYVHCCSHSFNLALCHSCKIQSVRNCVGTVKSVINFIKGSPKRTALLRMKIEEILPKCQTSTLTSMCETRWVENHNALLKFKELFKPILVTLEELSDDSDTDTSSNASALAKALTNGEFVVTLCFVTKVFSYTLTLCKILQSPLCDLKSATDHIANIADRFQKMRQDIEHEFAQIYKEAEAIMSDVGEEIRIPRRASLQRNRCNVNADTPEMYFRIAIAIPLIDDFNDQLNDRFLDHRQVFSSLNSLLPLVCCQPHVSINVENLMIYEDKIDLQLLEAEFDLWKVYWSKKDEIDRPSCAIEALGECNKDFYPNIFILLKIFATLPVTTCTPERTFSTLRRLKTYLRNSCGQNRLTGLALMSIHRDIDIPTNEVIDLFALKKDRRINLIL